VMFSPNNFVRASEHSTVRKWLVCAFLSVFRFLSRAVGIFPRGLVRETGISKIRCRKTVVKGDRQTSA
jgi:hypothetical protein